MEYHNHITSSHQIMLGKPLIKGTRITVEFILKKLSEGASVNEISSLYSITIEDVYAALHYASDVISKEEVINTK